jgi:SpoVK/Ycf46/Vps4 family AAA+-type ATPase
LAVEWVDFAAALAVVKPSALRDLDVQTMTSAGRNSGGGSAAAGGFGSFGGFDDLKARVRRSVIGPWAAPELHKALGVQPLSGALLHGPPGCGKTMLASAIAAECASAITMTMDTTTTTVTATAVAMTRTTPEVNGGGVGDVSGVGGGGGGDGVKFVHVRSTELLSKWLGESERLLRRLFARARGCPPCVLFFDDLDALVGKRALEGGGSGSGGGGLETRLLTTFLSEMDGVASGGGAGGVLVLAATQNINALDAALLRPGRLQESLFVGPPTSAEDRAAVLAVHTRPLPLAPLSAGGDNPAQVLGDVSGGGVGRGGDQVGGGRRGGCYGVSGGDDDQAAEDDDARLCTPNEKETAVQALVADLALRTHGFSCAELAALPRAAAKLALRRHLAEIESAVAGPAARRRKSAGLPPVTAKDFEAALSRVKQRQTSVVSAHLPSERKP